MRDIPVQKTAFFHSLLIFVIAKNAVGLLKKYQNKSVKSNNNRTQRVDWIANIS